ncbi:hypothetical protein O3P69_002311 [Scylla paramamosain]|uniref:Uncharacterized protein n=1 Tax=Scylla paramamosain TaxID=85552 RepID=A0AAW0V644_SCYPA
MVRCASEESCRVTVRGGTGLVWVVVVVVMMMVETASAVEGSPLLNLLMSTLSDKHLKTLEEILESLKPHEVPCCWHGYDAEGFTRFG